jgi:hypothetical protein
MMVIGDSDWCLFSFYYHLSLTLSQLVIKGESRAKIEDESRSSKTV